MPVMRQGRCGNLVIGLSISPRNKALIAGGQAMRKDGRSDEICAGFSFINWSREEWRELTDFLPTS